MHHFICNLHLAVILTKRNPVFLTRSESQEIMRLGVNYIYHRTIECFGLERTFKCHLVQPLL